MLLEDSKNTDLVVVIDKKGKIIYYNNFNDRINKFETSDTVGRYLWEIYPWVKDKDSPMFKVMETGQPILNQYIDHCINGKNMTSINSAFPLKTSNGIIGSIGLSVTSESLNHKDYGTKRRQTSNLMAKYCFNDIITKSSKVNLIKNNLRKASKTSSNIFIFGETGTGKELFAHSIHNSSPRSKKPFISQNCAAIPETLIESIFFGTCKGTFTGAIDKKGLFELCNGGTLFLDEINSMPLDLQVKILRVIEEKSFRRLGDTKDISCDVRIIAASNENPKEIYEKKKLRMDLYYRLSVVNCEIPPLRERIEDIDVLCEYFIYIFNNIFDRNIIGTTDAVKNVFYRHNWPGNVRELKNIIEGSFNIVEGNFIKLDDIPSYLLISNNEPAINPIGKTLIEKVNNFERNIIESTLTNHRYNIVATAKTLGLPRQTLYYKLKKHELLP